MAYEFYVTVVGSKQGSLKGESTSEEHSDAIEGLAFEYSVVAPRDGTTGQASGKRQHRPVTFTKAWGAASPQLFQALCTNETLKSVLFEFVQTSKSGEEVLFYTITLTEASVVGIRQHTPLDVAGSFDVHELEEVSLTFRKIAIEHVPGNTMAVDNWRSDK